jgi:hypothetical protein
MKLQSNRIRTLVFFIVCAQCLPAVWSLPAHAQVDSADYVLWRRSLVVNGVNACGQGEEIRLNLAYSAGLAQAPAATVRAFARLTDLNGRVLFTGNNETITVNGMRTENVNRRQLDVPQTGSLTLFAEWFIDAPGDFGADLPASAEVLDGCSGRVKYHTGQGLTLQQHPVPGRSNVFAVWVTVGFQPVSLASGQTLRLNIAQQWPLGVPPPTDPVSDYFLRIETPDGETRSVDERNLDFLPGQTLTVDFNRDLISEPGEPGTGRLTVWLVADYRAGLSPEQLAQIWSQHTLPQFPASLQLVDTNNSTAPPLPLPAVQIVRDSVWPVRTR